LKEALQSGFAAEFARLLANAYQVDPNASYLLLQRGLIERVSEDFKRLAGASLSRHKDRLVRLCAQGQLWNKNSNRSDLHELEDAARKILGVGVRQFKADVGANVQAILAQQHQAQAANQPPDPRRQVIVPGLGRLESNVVKEITDVVAPKNIWFSRSNELVVIEQIPIGFEYSSNPNVRFKVKSHSFGFRALIALQAKHRIEEFVRPGSIIKDEFGQSEFCEQSFSTEFCRGLVVNQELLNRLPIITRILTVPIPFLVNGQLIFPQEGYDERFGTYLIPGSPKIIPFAPDHAADILRDLHKEFCLKTDDNDQSLTHSIARMITPSTRGIIGFTTRSPLWVFHANRPRAGKDFLAMLTPIIYEGHAFEEQPMEDSSEETAKRLIAMARAGQRFAHFSNQQKHVSHATFIQAITSESIAGRNLGSNRAEDALKLPNEMEFSISYNAGITYRPDLPDRIRRIDLEFFEEDANSRTFSDPYLHATVASLRSRYISAIAALIQNWVDKSCPKGTPFTSFPRWGETVGGIMVAAGLGDPCLPQEDSGGSDRKTQAMRCLFQYAWDMGKGNPTQGVSYTNSELSKLIDPEPDPKQPYFMNPYAEEFNWFGSLREGEDAKSNRTRLGIQLREFNRRVLNGVKLTVDQSNTGHGRQTYIFAKTQ
jgi:hypothetical protein